MFFRFLNFQFYYRMTSEEKRVYLLLKAAIFHFHGLDPKEEVDLEEAGRRLEAPEELQWAKDFIDIVGDYPKDKRVALITMVWESNNIKGYVTEMEATAMVKLARDWKVEPELVSLVLK